ncbi:cytochrome P450 [Paraconexibacter antarcticus]|uniref:Cytochrome P450 n=1 Tax=Paraconexibacter antarcticus TaxID=2949664 RepID=A0ABY5DML0_9ACTN|nr:cytochrome P450 [Paraconexibacter antarcticus]UTI62287.1 cytochrome P450 [Paraconexibacter antarcticus]
MSEFVKPLMTRQKVQLADGDVLPPGPPLPAFVQTPLLWLARPSWLRLLARRYGRTFTLKDTMAGRIVVLADPVDVKALFTGSPDVFLAGEGNTLLGPIVGEHSVLLLDREEHLRERKLQLPAFHGERIARTVGLMRELTEAEVRTWPVGEPFALHERTRALTLEIIIRVVLGVEDDERARRLHDALRAAVEFRPSYFLLWVAPALRHVGRWKRFLAGIEAADELLFAEIAERRAVAGRADRGDVLSMLLDAHDEAGTPVDDRWVRDELMTLLVAGHETTATGLAWAFERLLRHPEALARVRAGLDDPRDPYVDAVVKETLRVRPVIQNVARVLARRTRVAGYDMPQGTLLLPSIALMHESDAHFPEAAAFRPERWLEGSGEPYTWIPFGGGVRRCLGATFALTEMAEVLRTVLREVEIEAVGEPEAAHMHHITLVPARGAQVRVRARRDRAQAADGAGAAPAPTPLATA